MAWLGWLGSVSLVVGLLLIVKALTSFKGVEELADDWFFVIGVFFFVAALFLYSRAG